MAFMASLFLLFSRRRSGHNQIILCRRLQERDRQKYWADRAGAGSTLLFDACSSREPVSSSLENALMSVLTIRRFCTNETAPPMTKTSQITLLPALLLGAIALFSFASDARAEQVAREQDIVNLRLGQRIKVDDGTCPAGQIKEVSGAKMIASGVVHTRKCIPRLEPKIK
jgi:hypothetical protein